MTDIPTTKKEIAPASGVAALPKRARQAAGFTLVELLVVIAIIAMLLTALIPAVQSLRESSRRAHCKNNALQLIMAMQNYEMAHEVYPAGVIEPSGGPIPNTASGHHHSWVIPLLPFLDEGNIHRQIDPELSVYAEAHRDVRQMSVQVLICPTEPEGYRDGKSNYAACHHDVEAPIAADNHGVFFLNSRITADDVFDGLSYTIFLGEKKMDPEGLGWMSGTRATLRNTGTPINTDPWSSTRKPMPLTPASGDVAGDASQPQGSEEQGDEETNQTAPEDPATEDPGTEDVATDVPATDGGGTESGVAQATPSEVSGGAGGTDDRSPTNVKPKEPELYVGGFSSHHPAGAHIAFGDGHIQFMDAQIGQRVFQQLGHRHDGKLLNAADFRE